MLNALVRAFWPFLCYLISPENRNLLCFSQKNVGICGRHLNTKVVRLPYN